MSKGKMNNVKKTIGWCDFTVNPIKGLCKGGCSYCYAINMYKRFPKRLDPTIRFIPDVIDEAAKLKKPSKIFICSTHDIMGDWIPDEWIETIIDKVKKYPQHTFQFLSKYATRYHKYIFPSNCWLGETCTKRVVRSTPVTGHTNYISFEPLHGQAFLQAGYDWIIIGAQTNPYVPPKRDWIEHLISWAGVFGIPIFMKSNLEKVWPDKLIQEFPQ